MKKQLQTIFFIALFLSSKIGLAQIDSLYYHDHSFESQYGAAGAFPSTDYLQGVVRFTPAIYPAKLVGLRAYFRNAADPAPFRFIVYNDASGSAAGPVGTAAYAGTITVNPASGGSQDSVYASYLDMSSSNFIILSGDVYCGVTQYSQLNGFVGAAVDAVPQNNSVNDRQWISTSQGAAGSWYQMLIWAGGGQWGFTAFFDYMTTVPPLSDEISFLLYPNPAKEKLEISSLGFGVTTGEIFIYNMFGEKVLADALRTTNSELRTIDVHALSSGIYYLEVKNDNKIFRSKFVKE